MVQQIFSVASTKEPGKSPVVDLPVPGSLRFKEYLALGGILDPLVNPAEGQNQSSVLAGQGVFGCKKVESDQSQSRRGHIARKGRQVTSAKDVIFMSIILIRALRSAAAARSVEMNGDERNWGGNESGTAGPSQGRLWEQSGGDNDDKAGAEPSAKIMLSVESRGVSMGEPVEDGQSTSTSVYGSLLRRQRRAETTATKKTNAIAARCQDRNR
ncbi:hypothetical protein LX36DRAFT_676102 [Colletotrichum falcatum]|nr:hypothetical protein LX36DRAFT_676102 [Colletotrichum falcatum]